MLFRFFAASSKPLEKTSFYSALDKNHKRAKKAKPTGVVFHSTRDSEETSDSESAEEHSNSEENVSETLTEKNRTCDLSLRHTKDSCEVPQHGDCKRTVSPSSSGKLSSSSYPSCGLFSKLDQSKSKFDLKTSKSVNKPFKPVSVRTLDSTQETENLAKPDSSFTDCIKISQDSAGKPSQNVAESQASNNSELGASQRTNLYSIDTDCWELSQTDLDISVTEPLSLTVSQSNDLPLLPRSPSPSSRSSMDSRSRPNSPVCQTFGAARICSSPSLWQTSKPAFNLSVNGNTESILETTDLIKESDLKVDKVGPAAEKSSPQHARMLQYLCLVFFN